MIEEVLFGTFVFFMFYMIISKIFRYSKSVDHISSAFLTLLFILFFYSTIPKHITFVFCVIGPVLFTKLVFDDLFAISYRVKYYRNVLLHILGFFIMSLVFYGVVINYVENNDLFFAIFVTNVFTCILYCFYFVFGYRKLDEQIASSPHIKTKRIIEFGNFSKNQKDNLSTLPLSLEEIEKAEQNAYDHTSDAELRKTEKIINIKREHVLKSISSKHSLKG